MTDRTTFKPTFKQCIGNVKTSCSVPGCANKTFVSSQRGAKQCEYCGFNRPVCLNHCTAKCTIANCCESGTNMCYECFAEHTPYHRDID
jgi:hypothetical protein